MVIVGAFWVDGVETPYQSHIGHIPFGRTILKFKWSFRQELVLFFCSLGVGSSSRHAKMSMTRAMNRYRKFFVHTSMKHEKYRMQKQPTLNQTMLELKNSISR